MSTTTEALELVKLLKPKIGEQAAAKLIDFAEKQRDKSVDRLWIAFIGGFSIMVASMFYLHGDTKANMKELKTDMNKRFEKIEAEQKEQRKLLLQVLQKVSLVK